MTKERKAAGVNEFADTHTSGKDARNLLSSPYDANSSKYVWRISTTHYTKDPINRKASNVLYRSRRFMHENPETWNRFKADVEVNVANKRPWTIQSLIEQERKYHHTHISHTISSGLARLLCEQVDGAYIYVKLRRSVFERARDEREAV